MHAWKCETWGAPRHLKQGIMPDPECGSAEVEIMVKACGVNFSDLVVIAGHSQVRPALPFVPGIEIAGWVNRVGPGADGFQVGDKVAAYVKYGGYADRAVAPVSQVAHVPESIPLSVAAAFPVSYGSALLALQQTDLSAGEVILVGGAGGAVGSACVELAKLQGAMVIACVGDNDKEQLARKCGADETVSSRSRNLQEEINQVAPEGIDVIIDPIGGGFFDESLRTLNYDGRIAVVGFASGKIPKLRLQQLLVNHRTITGSSFGLTCARKPQTVARLWPKLTDLLSQGQINPRVSKTLPFTDLPQALQMIQDRKVAGRIVLT